MAFVMQDGKVWGPYTEAAVQEQIAQGRIRADAFLSATPNGPWSPVAAAPLPILPARPAKEPGSIAMKVVLAIGALVIAAPFLLVLFPGKGARVVTAKDVEQTYRQPSPATTIDPVSAPWDVYDKLPSDDKTALRLALALEQSRAAATTPAGVLRAESAYRERAARRLTPKTRATGPDFTVLVPSPDTIECRMWAGQWTRPDTAESARQIGFTVIRCPDGKEWKL